MLKIVTVCGAGVGSSMMLRLFSQQILDEAGIEAEVEASDIGSVTQTVMIWLSQHPILRIPMRTQRARIIRIDNMMDKSLFAGTIA